MTATDAYKKITGQLKEIYNESEASSIADWVMEYLTGKSRLERAAQKERLLLTDQVEKLSVILARLLEQEPIQYVLNESWFGGQKFYVDKNVLIPRPETEELVEWIVSDYKIPIHDITMLDIGTGSGCIPISLYKKIQKAKVWSCDISKAALNVAIKNAAILGADINYIQLDFLDTSSWSKLPSFDIIVSNPPYVPEKDKEQMHPNVLQFEPASALFVPDEDPLIFYKAIAEFGKTHLKKNGNIYLEIHESLGEATTKLFRENGYVTELKKDMQQKDRLVKAGRK
ncbi:MAG: peptide chain release factor N(5)-glutamine methyltransferase [Chitinophagaceae bacterium]